MVVWPMQPVSRTSGSIFGRCTSKVRRHTPELHTKEAVLKEMKFAVQTNLLATLIKHVSNVKMVAQQMQPVFLMNGMRF